MINASAKKKKRKKFVALLSMGRVTRGSGNQRLGIRLLTLSNVTYRELTGFTALYPYRF
jgi:hypothetical protein